MSFIHKDTVTHNGHTYNMGDKVIILSHKGIKGDDDEGKIAVIDDDGFDIGDPDGEVRVEEIKGSDITLFYHWFMLNDIAPADPNELMFRDWKGG
jgi:hypothetical protein